MSQLVHPEQKTSYDKVVNDAQGNPLYGYRTVEGQQEIVHIPTGKSNMTFHKPEQATKTYDHEHAFRVENMGSREFICNGCDWAITVHISQIEENKEGQFLKLKQGRFKVIQ